MTARTPGIALMLGMAMAAGGLAGASPQAWAQPAPLPGVSLAMGKVRTDAAGAFVTVTATNSTAETLPELQVKCTFYAGGRAVGTSATKIFSVFAGTSGSDQVRLLGATAANRAVCAIQK